MSSSIERWASNARKRSVEVAIASRVAGPVDLEEHGQDRLVALELELADDPLERRVGKRLLTAEVEERPARLVAEVVRRRARSAPRRAIVWALRRSAMRALESVAGRLEECAGIRRGGRGPGRRPAGGCRSPGRGAMAATKSSHAVRPIQTVKLPRRRTMTSRCLLAYGSMSPPSETKRIVPRSVSVVHEVRMRHGREFCFLSAPKTPRG